MFRKIIASFTLICLILCMSGCYSNRLITRQELEQHPQGNITAVLTTDATFEFSDFPKGKVKDDTLIVGWLENGVYKKIPFREVSMVYVEKFDLLRTGIICLAIAGGVLSILFTIALSNMGG